jgi:hypothetical protein
MKGKDVKIQARYEGKAGRMIKKRGGEGGRRKVMRRRGKGQESTRDEQRDRKIEKSQRKEKGKNTRRTGTIITKLQLN